MILAAHQPQYLPWLGFFDKLDSSDVFVILDTVQFKKNEWQNRNRIKGPGGPQWLTVPVRHKFPQRIDEVLIDGDRWLRKHRRSLEVAYAKSEHFRPEAGLLDELYTGPWESLADLNVRSVTLLASRLGIRTPIHLSSRMDDLADDQADERLIGLCERLGADTYLAGTGGQAYMDLARWRRSGIRVRFQEFRHPVHAQAHGSFLPALSAVDLLFNCGGDGFSLVRSARKEAA